MVKCLNIGKNTGQPIYWSISSYKPRALDVFTFEFAILSGFTRKYNSVLLTSIPLSLIKTKKKMDSLLFLIKKHNNNKTVRYIDKLAYKMFITNKIKHGIHHILYCIPNNKLKNVYHTLRNQINCGSQPFFPCPPTYTYGNHDNQS